MKSCQDAEEHQGKKGVKLCAESKLVTLKSIVD